MKSKRISAPAMERYSMIEPLESRIAPAGVATGILSNAHYITAVLGRDQVVTAGEVLSTGVNGGGLYLLYVEQGAVVVHTTDYNHDGELDYNDISGLSVANGTRVDVFVDIHGDVVTNLNSDFTLTDSDNNAANGRDGRVLQDANINAIYMTSITPSDFTATTAESSATIANDHLAMSSYSIFGNIFAGGGLGVSNDSTSGLHINSAGASLQSAKFTGNSGSELYVQTQPTIGSIYVGTAASGQPFSFGVNNVAGTIMPFNPAPGEAGASVYNIASNGPFNIGDVYAGNGGFNAPGGSILNPALNGTTGGGYSLVAGNAGDGITGHAGGSIANYSEVGTITGHVLLQSGNGGTAWTGTGGNAGSITLSPAAPISVNAHFQMIFGNGGNGYTGGGNGGGLPSGTFITPTGQLTDATIITTSMRSADSVGQTQSFDFNNDGYSDAVFATENPNSLQVAFGNLQGSHFGLNSSTIFLDNAPADITSIVVGDFSGNPNHPDIAVASGKAGYSGIEIYFSEYNGNVFTGFSAPEFVQLPNLSSQGFYYTGTAIYKMVAGDFAGNAAAHGGALDLAMIVQLEENPLKTLETALIYLTNDGTGHFAPDFSAGNPVFVFASGAPAAAILQPTALHAGATHDVIVTAFQGDIGGSIYDYSNGFVNQTGAILFGKVDTGRTGGKPTLTQFQVQALTVIQDPLTPNNADIVALSQAPTAPNFLVTFTGDGKGNFSLASVGGTGGVAGYLAGIPLDKETTATTMVAVPNSGMTAYSDVAILGYGSKNNNVYVVDFAPDLSTGTMTTSWGAPWASDQNTTIIAFDTYNPHPGLDSSVPGSGPYQFGFLYGEPDGNYSSLLNQQIDVLEPGGNINFGVVFKSSGYYVTAGNGGSALDGAAGHGGSIGQSLTVTNNNGAITATGSLNFLFPSDADYNGTMTFQAGNGGTGFKAGGAGGNIIGLSAEYAAGTSVMTGNVFMIAGDGGASFTGTGGTGGTIAQTAVASGDEFQAGSGGAGVIGGSGGSVVGTDIAGVTAITANSITLVVYATGGDGGTGITQGGNGGSVNSFNVQFPPPVGGPGGFLEYAAGNAGDAVAGHGGTGGSILNSSPLNTSLTSQGGDNHLSGDMFLIAGNGGNGLYAGNGGAITNFLDNPTVIQLPGSLTVVGGNGGTATLGNGGTGGAISNFSSPSTGQGVEDPLTYDRIVAGEGGNSMGGAGGAGGAVSNVNTTSSGSNAGYFVAAGAGGNGLTSGGAGGSVLSATVNTGSNSNTGSNTGKVVIVAGDGGTSYSVAPLSLSNATDVAFSMGAVNGAGGNGGSIQNFSQPGSLQTHVDLIAGNGGATPNHSAAGGQVAVDNSGQGGSILNVSITGTIGNMDPTVAIQSYNDFFAGQTMQQFIDQNVRVFNPVALTDATGNVGLVAGAAGQVLDNLPSSNGINGSVNNVHASQIMSMVAGSVDQINFIQKLTNFGATISGGIVGAPKTASAFGYTAVAGDYNYVTGEGVLLNDPMSVFPSAENLAGGILIDGAIMTHSTDLQVGDREFVD